MKPYPKYKEVEAERTVQIPEQWELRRLKQTALINPSKGNSQIDKNSDEEVCFLPMEKVNADGTYAKDTLKPINELYNGFTYFEEKDVIFAKITPCFENGKGALLDSLPTKVGFGSTEFHVLRPIQGRSSSQFIYYFTVSHTFRTIGEAFMSGAAGQKRVPTDFVENFILPCPPIKEQQQIASYLDHKTALIDTLIEKKKRLIDLLKEERTAVINEAVTKGLDPNVPMKASGVGWLGEIPEHWEVKRLKNVGRVRQGLQIPIAKRFSEKVPNSYEYITVKSLNNPDSAKEYIQNPPDNVICSTDDIIVARTGATGSIITNVQGVFHNNFFLFDYNKEIYNKYFILYYLTNSRITEHLLLVAGVTTIPDLNHDDFYETPFFEPPRLEQDAIVQYIIKETSRIDTIIAKTEREIELLQEYRTALISEVVTGKIDVRDWKEPE